MNRHKCKRKTVVTDSRPSPSGWRQRYTCRCAVIRYPPRGLVADMALCGQHLGLCGKCRLARLRKGEKT